MKESTKLYFSELLLQNRLNIMYIYNKKASQKVVNFINVCIQFNLFSIDNKNSYFDQMKFAQFVYFENQR